MTIKTEYYFIFDEQECRKKELDISQTIYQRCTGISTSQLRGFKTDSFRK